MNRAIWERDHYDDLELWRGSVHLATVKPAGEWLVTFGPFPRARGKAGSVAAAKVAAKAAALEQEARHGHLHELEVDHG